MSVKKEEEQKRIADAAAVELANKEATELLKQQKIIIPDLAEVSAFTDPLKAS